MSPATSLLRLLRRTIRCVAQPDSALAILCPGRTWHPSRRHPPLFRPQRHEFQELAVCCEGRMLVVSSGGVHRLRAGDAMVILPGTWHYETYADASRPYTSLWFVARAKHPFCLLASYRRRKFSIGAHQTGEWIQAGAFSVEELAREMLQKRPHWRETARALLVRLLVDWSRHAAGMDRSPAAAQKLDPVRRARLILETRFREPLRIKSLAEELGRTPNHLSHCFKKAHGVSFKRYLREIRIHHARLLLREGRSIKEVSAECGFRGVPYFTRVFKQRCRSTPARFARTV